MTLHYAPTTPEEEELAIALALSASLSSPALRKPSPSAAARPDPSPSASSSALFPQHPPSLHPSGPHRHGSSSTSPSRGRWPAGSSAPVSPRAAAPGLGAPLASGVRAAPSPVRPARPQQAPQPQLPPIAPPIPRSQSATGPSGMFSGSKGSGGGGAGASTSTSGGVAAPAPAPTTVLQLHSDPEACAGCGRGFGMFHRSWVTGMGRKWHPGCFKCGFCKEPISNGRGAFSYQMHPNDPLPYHQDCYRHVHHPTCHVCSSYIAPSADGVISYRENGFWRERYCSTHADSELTRCCACSRLQKQGEEWAPLPDNRQLCLQCLSHVVLDTQDAQPLYDDVLAFYRTEMRLPLPYKPPLLLVDGNTLNTHAAAEGRDDSVEAPVFHVRGLCVAHVYSHIPSMSRVLGGSVRSISTALGRSPASSVHCVVKVLLLLYGLPRLLSGSIMAHELMHAWLRMDGVVGLPLKVEEGLCQLMACLWLDRQHELLKGKPEEQRLASFFSYQIRTDTSDVYGEGFREAMETFQTIGLATMIKNVKLYGRFTPP